MLTVAVVGCGKIADEHADQILTRSGLPAGRVLRCRTFDGAAVRGAVRITLYSELAAMLAEIRPTVVHIATPPPSHFSLGLQCLDAGAHLFVEKPFTMTADETDALLARALARGVTVTVDHNLQFTEPAIRMRQIIADGYLGGAPLHLESYYSYDLGDPAYARAFLRDSGHWVRSLPGGLLQNIVSHGIARIADFFSTDTPTVIAHGFTSAQLRLLGEDRLRDELRMLIHDDSVTAYFTFSSQMKPQVSEVRVFGPTHGLLLDDAHHLLIRMDGTRYKSYLDTIIPPFIQSRRFAGACAKNVVGLVTGRLHGSEGMRNLIDQFYTSVKSGGAPPISYDHIRFTARVMDQLFAQLHAPRTPDEANLPLLPR